MDKDKMYHIFKVMEGKNHCETAWYRCIGIENFINIIEKTHQIVGFIPDGNKIGFMLIDNMEMDCEEQEN